MELQEIAAARLAAALECHFGDLAVADTGIDAVNPAQSRDIGDRLNVENEYWTQELTVTACRAPYCAGLLARPRSGIILIVPAALRLIDPALGKCRADIVLPLRLAVGARDFAI